MTKIVEYTTQKGEKLYKFQAYLGINQATGKRVQVSRSGFRTQRAAKIELSRLQYEFEHSVMSSNENITYSDVFEQWKQVYTSTVTESTQNRVFGIFRLHVLDVLGDKRIKDIDLPMCQRLIDDVAASVKDVRKVGQYVGLVFKYAQKCEYADRNPMQFVTYPKRPREKHKEFWNREQLIEFLEILDRDYTDKPRIRTYLRLLALTGARKAEILGLKVNDINYKDKSIRIEQSITRKLDNTQAIGDTKTFNSERTLYLDSTTMDILHDWQTQLQKMLVLTGVELKPTQLLFPNEKNKPTSVMKPNRWLENIITKNNLKRITPHGLRATMATLLSESGLPLKATALMLGDTEAVVLKSYIQQDNTMKQESAKKYQNYLGL